MSAPSQAENKGCGKNCSSNLLCRSMLKVGVVLLNLCSRRGRYASAFGWSLGVARSFWWLLQVYCNDFGGQHEEPRSTEKKVRPRLLLLEMPRENGLRAAVGRLRIASQALREELLLLQVQIKTTGSRGHIVLPIRWMCRLAGGIIMCSHSYGEWGRCISTADADAAAGNQTARACNQPNGKCTVPEFWLRVYALQTGKQTTF